MQSMKVSRILLRTVDIDVVELSVAATKIYIHELSVAFGTGQHDIFLSIKLLHLWSQHFMLTLGATQCHSVHGETRQHGIPGEYL